MQRFVVRLEHLYEKGVHGYMCLDPLGQMCWDFVPRRIESRKFRVFMSEARAHEAIRVLHGKLRARGRMDDRANEMEVVPLEVMPCG